jgi:hypothetical protein
MRPDPVAARLTSDDYPKTVQLLTDAKVYPGLYPKPPLSIARAELLAHQAGPCCASYHAR